MKIRRRGRDRICYECKESYRRWQIRREGELIRIPQSAFICPDCFLERESLEHTGEQMEEIKQAIVRTS